jgi:hypothetical protein
MSFHPLKKILENQIQFKIERHILNGTNIEVINWRSIVVDVCFVLLLLGVCGVKHIHLWQKDSLLGFPFSPLRSLLSMLV